MLSIPGFRDIEKISEGGSSVLYRGISTLSDEPLAIKVAREGFDLRIDKEAKTQYRLSNAKKPHPNIVEVYSSGFNNSLDDSGLDEGLGHFFFSMELMDRSLQDALNEGKMPVERAMKYLLGILDGLDMAHHNGVVHGDIKAENILLGEDGDVIKLSDFGSGLRYDDKGLKMSGPSTRFGTPDYMAPEVSKGEKPTYASDIYSLGLLMWKVFVGEGPVYGKRLEDICPDMESGILNTISCCIEVDPAKRLQSIKAVKKELRRSIIYANCMTRSDRKPSMIESEQEVAKTAQPKKAEEPVKIDEPESSHGEFLGMEEYIEVKEILKDFEKGADEILQFRREQMSAVTPATENPIKEVRPIEKRTNNRRLVSGLLAIAASVAFTATSGYLSYIERNKTETEYRIATNENQASRNEVPLIEKRADLPKEQPSKVVGQLPEEKKAADKADRKIEETEISTNPKTISYYVSTFDPLNPLVRVTHSMPNQYVFDAKAIEREFEARRKFQERLEFDECNPFTRLPDDVKAYYERSKR